MFKFYLQEIFDPKNVEDYKIEQDGNSYSIFFELDNKKYRVEFHRHHLGYFGDQILSKILNNTTDISLGNIYQIMFMTDDEYGDVKDITNARHAGKLFGIIISIIKKFIKTKNPEILIFSGEKTKKENVKIDRGKFYTKLVNKFSNEIKENFHIKSKHSNNMHNFAFIRNDIYEKAKEEIDSI